MKLKPVTLWLLFLLLWIFMFSVAGYRVLDPDFGWHIRMGEYISRNGIPQTDPLSYTMPSYPFIDHEWLTNVLMYKIQTSFGYPAQVLIFAVLAGIFLWLLMPRNRFVYALVPILLGAGAWLTRGGVRPQILDWLFLTLLLRLLWHNIVWKKWRLAIVPMFCLWANLHGGFAVGPVVLAVTIILKSWNKKHLDLVDLLVWLGGLVATWLNPYGPRLWQEVWMQMTDSGLRWSISEWRPFWTHMELGIWLLTALTGSLLTIAKSKPELWKLGVALGLFLAGLSSLRHIPLLAIMLVLLSADTLETLAATIRADRLSWARAKKFYFLLVIVITFLFLQEAGAYTVKAFRDQVGLYYPSGAVDYLKQNRFPGQIFSEYGWGGYLLWRYPDKQVFIDGRMPSWRWTAPAGESDWAFKDYSAIRNEGDFQSYFDKFNVRTVLWPKRFIKNSGSGFISWLTALINAQPGTDQPKLPDRLQTAGWITAYEDQTSVVLIRPSPTP